jgi:RNA polymerase sigma-70 factor (ECF subfamily)
MSDTPRKDDPVAAASQPTPHVAPLDLEGLYRAHHQVVLRAAYRVTGDAAEAEDVLQTVFLRLLHHEQKTDLAPSPAAYLKRAAINAAIDVVRRRKDDRRADLNLLEPLLSDGPANRPDQGQRESELKSWLRLALGRITPSAAEVFALHFFEGLDHQQISVDLDITTNAVAVLLHRARKQLRADLEGAKGDPT